MTLAEISDRLAGALCETLLHSLWEGLLLAALAGAIIICTRRATSAIRYIFLISALGVFAVVVSATFVCQYQGSGVADTVPQAHGTEVGEKGEAVDASEKGEASLEAKERDGLGAGGETAEAGGSTYEMTLDGQINSLYFSEYEKPTLYPRPLHFHDARPYEVRQAKYQSQ